MMKKLVLHFDLNRTILMSDVAGGRSMENTLNYLLSECTYGRIESNEWICVSKEPSLTPPAPTLVTYKKYIDDLYPYKSMHGETEALNEVKAYNKKQKKTRTALQSAFTKGPGRSISPSYDHVLSCLYFPEGPKREAAKAAASTLPECGLKEAWSDGRYYILPSFLNLLFYIENQRSQIDLKLVFRTFGEDIIEVAKEIDFLVDGRHPLFPGVLKSLLSSMRLEPPFATFYRDAFDSNGTVLAVNTLQKIPFQSTNTVDTPQDFYPSDVKIVRGFPLVTKAIDDLLGTRNVIAIRDYWEWWSSHAEHAEYGKLLLTDTASRSVFFDDHVEEHEAHIVDVRDASTGDIVPFDVAKELNLRRVEPFYAITDTSYYINQVNDIISK